MKTVEIPPIVQGKLKWSDIDYNSYQYEQGVAYLNLYLNDDQDSISRLETCRMFWIWWVKRWTDRDVEFLNFCENISPAKWEELYRSIHEPKLLSNRIYPNKIIWKEALNSVV